ncbi:MAG: dicarboxylate/amino acid:cation symporter, partial [Terriglobia bacterium]
MNAEKKETAPATKILLGLAAGGVAGVTANYLFSGASWLTWLVENVTRPAGQIWLRSLIMIVVPLVFASLTLGVASLGDVRKLGRVGFKTIGYFLLVTTLASVVGLTLVNLIRPGAGLPGETREQLLAQFGEQARQSVEQTQGLEFGVELLVNIVPRNPLGAAARGEMLGLIFFSLIFGAALSVLPAERSQPLLKVVQAIGDAVVVIIHWVMKLAPIG